MMARDPAECVAARVAAVGGSFIVALVRNDRGVVSVRCATCDEASDLIREMCPATVVLDVGVGVERDELIAALDGWKPLAREAERPLSEARVIARVTARKPPSDAALTLAQAIEWLKVDQARLLAELAAQFEVDAERGAGVTEH